MNANAEDVNEARPMAAGSATTNCDISNNLNDSTRQHCERWQESDRQRERGRERGREATAARAREEAETTLVD